MPDWAKEAIGILGTLIILFSFTQSKLIRVRIINIVGSVLFVVYGVLIGAYSTWILNAAMVALNVTMIIRSKRLEARNDKNMDAEK